MGVLACQSVAVKVRPNSANLFVSQKFLIFVYWFLALGDEREESREGVLFSLSCRGVAMEVSIA